MQKTQGFSTIFEECGMGGWCTVRMSRKALMISVTRTLCFEGWCQEVYSSYFDLTFWEFVWKPFHVASR